MEIEPPLSGGDASAAANGELDEIAGETLMVNDVLAVVVEGEGEELSDEAEEDEIEADSFDKDEDSDEAVDCTLLIDSRRGGSGGIPGVNKGVPEFDDEVDEGTGEGCSGLEGLA